MAKGGLDKWFKEKWVDISRKEKRWRSSTLWKKIGKKVEGWIPKMRSCFKGFKDDSIPEKAQ